MEPIQKTNYIQSVTNRLHPNKDLPIVDHFYYFIHHMDMGEEFVINDPDLVRPENKDIILNHVIWFIQNELGHYRSFDLELSQDGTKFRKIAYGTAKEPVKEPAYYRLQEVETFFEGRSLPKEMSLSNNEKIIDLPLFVETHLNFIRNNSDNILYKPYYDRLIQVYNYLLHLQT